MPKKIFFVYNVEYYYIYLFGLRVNAWNTLVQLYIRG